LRGKRIGVLGNGASAFDNAATALEEGAGRVDLCLRKDVFPRVNAHKWMEFAGFLTLDTPSWIRSWEFVRVEVRIRDRGGNLSDKVTLEARIGSPTREGLPSEWADAAQYHLGVLFFQFQDDNGNGMPFGRKGRF
jgi:cation diffusion facilitator CzcD-associated flavoprotein CzcO